MKSTQHPPLTGLLPLLFTLLLTVTAGAHPPVARSLAVAEVVASTLPTLAQSQIKQGPTPPPAALATPPARDAQSDSVGATVGQFRIDESGNLTYSLPVQINVRLL